jgi:hypothetical protein
MSGVGGWDWRRAWGMVARMWITVKVSVLLFYHSNVRWGSGVVGRSWREFWSLVRQITSRLSPSARLAMRPIHIEHPK